MRDLRSKLRWSAWSKRELRGLLSWPFFRMSCCSIGLKSQATPRKHLCYPVRDLEEVMIMRSSYMSDNFKGKYVCSGHPYLWNWLQEVILDPESLRRITQRWSETTRNSYNLSIIGINAWCSCSVADCCSKTQCYNCQYGYQSELRQLYHIVRRKLTTEGLLRFTVDSCEARIASAK